MDKVECPKCGHLVEIDLKNSVTDDGEVYRCPVCGFEFRYVKE